VIAAQMAVEDYGGKAGGKPVEVISADHQNKTDIGVGIARRWYENENIDAIFDLPNSAIALAVAGMTEQKEQGVCRLRCRHGAADRRKNAPPIPSTGPTTPTPMGGVSVKPSWRRAARNGSSSPPTMHSVTILKSRLWKPSRHLVARWSVRFGTHLAPQTTHRILLQAQASGADILGIANAGDDTITLDEAGCRIWSHQETEARWIDFGHEWAASAYSAGGPRRADHESILLGLNRGARAASPTVFAERHPQQNYPNDMQAGVYASVVHYLKAVDKVGGAVDGKAVVAAMKAIPTDDALFGKGYIRADGRKIHPLYLLEVKKTR